MSAPVPAVLVVENDDAVAAMRATGEATLVLLLTARNDAEQRTRQGLPLA